MNIVNENHRYIVPMSLWLVVVIQRMIPSGGAVSVVRVHRADAGQGVIVDDAAHRALPKARCASCAGLTGRIAFIANGPP